MAGDIMTTRCTAKKGLFIRFAEKTASWSGHPGAFLIAIAMVIGWAVTGPLFGFSNTWQLIINTGTTIMTFLMVFLIQNTQNRDARAMQLKLDELIRATEGAHTVLLDFEELSEKELKLIQEKYETIAREARKRVRAGGKDTNMPNVVLDEE
jgi:low affinity Fe/Cu permease